MTSYFRMIKVLVAQDEYHQGTSCDLELQDNCILYLLVFTDFISCMWRPLLLSWTDIHRLEFTGLLTNTNEASFIQDRQQQFAPNLLCHLLNVSIADHTAQQLNAFHHIMSCGQISNVVKQQFWKKHNPKITDMQIHVGLISSPELCVFGNLRWTFCFTV